MQLPDRVITALDEALDNNLPPEVPGAAVAIIAPEGEWFGASGVSNLAENTSLQPDDRFEAGSITKTFVATTVLQLTEEDQLSLDDTLTDWLPTTVTDIVPNASDITIEQLLNHTSGITDYLDILAAEATVNPALFVQQWEGEQLVSFIDGVEPFFEPGTDWQYSNTNYILAGLVIESVTGNSYGQEIRDRILDPLELENTFVFGEEDIPGGYIKGYWDFNGDGTLDDLSITNLTWAGSAGSIISNTEDLADFFEGLLVDGELLEPETLDEMLDTIAVDSPNYDSYGLGIGTLESPDRFWYAHRGQTLGFRSNVWYSPLEDITYVELINGRSTSNLVSDLLPTYRRTITPPTPDIVTYEFEWEGQIAGFSVDGEFSYDISQTYEDGIVREENLESFDINFFDPEGNLLRSYEDNHLTFPEFNFAFDTATEEILQDGYFLGEDGFNFGEKTPTEDGFSGLNFWSRPEFNSQGEVPPPHSHIDDWADEFGFPIGFGSHEDVAFFTRTTQELIDTGRVGETYLDSLQDSLDEFGERINVFTPQNQIGIFEVDSGVTSLFLNFSLFEQAGLIIQDATPTATPFSNQFQLGFEIDETTDFQFETSVPVTPLGGTIEHTGDITFLVGGDTLLTIGDFSIGFDANRVNDTNSGFFVADTLEDGLGIDILFDISIPGRFIVADNELTIADADLLLAPELAEILGLKDAVGTDVGDTRIDASLTTNDSDIIGTDTDEILNGNDSDNLVAGLLGDDTLLGNGGDDVLRGDLNSRSPGSTVGGDDVISGGDGNDQIGGKGGNDLLSGDAGDDLIWGDAGDDTIMGVTGNDTLTGDDFSGGSGSDLFVFGNGDGTDIITDFDVTEDLIGLVEGELTFADISIIEIEGNAAIQVTATGETLAVLDGVEISAITEELFMVTPDVTSA